MIKIIIIYHQNEMRIKKRRIARFFYIKSIIIIYKNFSTFEYFDRLNTHKY